MKIGVLGTGTVGRTVGSRLAERGHEVILGTRDVSRTLARTEPDAMGNPPFSTWHEQHPQVTLGSFTEAAAHGEMVINATGGGGSIEALTVAGADTMAGKALLDIANPLDFSRGVPPTLFVKDTDSLGEQIQRAFPDVRVVKALNTMTAALMADPAQTAGGEHTTFVSGNDEDAKKAVTALLEDLGHADVIDLGDITTARGSEMLLPIWLRLWGALGTPMFNFKIVR